MTFSGVYYPTFHHELHKLYDIINAFELHRGVKVFKSTIAFIENKFKKYWKRLLPLYYVPAVLDQGWNFLMWIRWCEGLRRNFRLTKSLPFKMLEARCQECYTFTIKKYGGFSAAFSSSASLNKIPPSVASWQTVKSIPGFGHSSSLSSTRSKLENHYEAFFFFYKTRWSDQFY